jgi:phosphonate transport system substrate-binding protein
MAADRPSRVRALAVTASLVSVLSACPSAPYPEGRVDTAKAPSAAPAPTGGRGPKLRFSVAAMLSPQDSLAAYSELFKLMADRLGLDVEFVQRKTYREVNDLLLSGDVDAAIVCTGGFLELERTAARQIELLAVPIVGGVTTYRSYVIVPAASPARSLADLAKKRFAFTDELSLTGRAYAVHWLRQRRATPETFFASVQFTRSHDRSVEAVAKGLVDGACVDSLIFDEMLKGRPELAGAVKVVDRSPLFGSPPVVAAAALPPERRAAIRAALLALSGDPEGRRALAATGFDGFAAVTPAHYDGARTVMKATW